MNCVHMDKHINWLCDGICNFFFPLMEIWILNNLFSEKDNNTMLLIAFRKVHFKTGKVKCHGKVILLFFLLYVVSLNHWLW